MPLDTELDYVNKLRSMKYALTLALIFVGTQAAADSWPLAKVVGLASPTGQIVVRVAPGSNVNAVDGPTAVQNGKSATATFYRLNATANYERVKDLSLLNPIAPAYAAVADSGELITLDNWHQVGIGNAVAVVYSPAGQVLRSYSLADIYTEAEVKKFDRSASSIWWRCSSQPMLEPRTGVLEFMDAFGENVSVNFRTGVIKRTPTSQTGC